MRVELSSMSALAPGNRVARSATADGSEAGCAWTVSVVGGAADNVVGATVGPAVAWDLVQTFLKACFRGEERFRRRLEKVAAIETKTREK